MCSATFLTSQNIFGSSVSSLLSDGMYASSTHRFLDTYLSPHLLLPHTDADVTQPPPAPAPSPSNNEKIQGARRQLRRLLSAARVGPRVHAAVGAVPAVHGSLVPGALRARVVRLAGVSSVLREAPRDAQGAGRARALRRPGSALDSELKFSSLVVHMQYLQYPG